MGLQPRHCHLTFLFFLILIPNCTTISKAPIQEPLDDQTTRNIIATIQEQDLKVHSFYAHGLIASSAWYGQSEANILIAGEKSPFKIKIEITQTWGHPIMHILIVRARLEVLSFKNKALYYAPFTPESLSKIFPGDIDPEFLWGALRGYPNLITHQYAKSLKRDQITLFQGGGREVQVIDLHPKSLMPGVIHFPNTRISVSFSEFQENGDLYYARHVDVSQRDEKKRLALKDMKFVFNKPIPEEIFILNKPPAFETLPLYQN